MLSGVGVTAPPLIGIGSAAQQALDIKMAIQVSFHLLQLQTTSATDVESQRTRGALRLEQGRPPP